MLSDTPVLNGRACASRPEAPDGSRWAMILSGGEGTRMRPLIERWLGEDRPKQYCTFTGSRSMLQHTADRAAELVKPGRVVTVIGHGHRRFFGPADTEGRLGRILDQPSNRGTAAGILLAATDIFERDPFATVIILPSDHYIHPDSQFRRCVNHAFSLAERFDDRLILLGAVPSRPEIDYGWIESSPRPASVNGNGSENGTLHSAAQVKGFHEKPVQAVAERLLSQGSLWNTMVIAAKVKLLRELGWRYLPQMMERFEFPRRLLHAAGHPMAREGSRREALEYVYRSMETADFSRAVLQRAGPWSMVLPMRQVEWCDWGRPERVIETLEFLGVRPAFPIQFARELDEVLVG